MILYRVIPKEKQETEKGINSFTYDDKEYIHFYILPEHAEIIQIHKYYIKDKKSYILKCNIPYQLLEFGIGLYSWNGYKNIPFLEARIKKNDFLETYILGIYNKVNEKWKNHKIYERYLVYCVYSNFFKFIKNDKVIFNSNFNFLHYFNIDDLNFENIYVSNYPIEKDYNELKKENFSILKRLYISFQEFLEIEDRFLTK